MNLGRIDPGSKELKTEPENGKCRENDEKNEEFHSENK